MIKKIFIAFTISFLTLLGASDKVLIPDPCKLLTPQELERIVEIPLKPGRLEDHRSTFNGLSCFYFSAKQFEKPGSVNITIDTTANMKKTDSIWRSAKELYDKKVYACKEALRRRKQLDTFCNVENLGDDACWNGVSLIILDGDNYINIRASGGKKLSSHSSKELDKMIYDQELKLTKEIAKQILDRLEQKR